MRMDLAYMSQPAVFAVPPHVHWVFPIMLPMIQPQLRFVIMMQLRKRRSDWRDRHHRLHSWRTPIINQQLRHSHWFVDAGNSRIAMLYIDGGMRNERRPRSMHV